MIVRILTVIICWSAPSLWANETEMVADEPSPLYSYFELRHHFDLLADHEQTDQSPSLNVRWQLGRRFQNGRLDAYTVLGAGKVSNTQQMVARRPEFAADIYPFTHPNFVVRQYNLFLPPFKTSADAESQGDLWVQDEETSLTHYPLDCVVYMPGLDLNAQFSITSAPSIKLLIGGEGWTYLYSRPQYVEVDTDSAGLGFATAESDDSSNKVMIEDEAMRGTTQAMLGLRLQEGSALAEFSGYYKNYFYPVYQLEPQWDYHYAATRQSFYRLRLRQELTSQLVLVNDFYHFYEGLFEAQETKRHFRNILRLVYIL